MTLHQDYVVIFNYQIRTLVSLRWGDAVRLLQQIRAASKSDTREVYADTNHENLAPWQCNT